MKAKVLIFTIIFSLNFVNYCEAQIIEGVVSGLLKKSKKKKQKQQSNTDETLIRQMKTESNDDLISNDDLMLDPMSIEDDAQVTINNNENKPNDNIKSNDDVTLTVSADGATKEEATKIALRSAIEQAYGTFVSANTTILNDEMVKDEIVTISNGNIKSYKEIASAILPNGRTTVTLNAVVSISKLTSYAQSKGATTEFAGATFAMNVRMRELNKKNEMKALDNLIAQIKALLPVALERELVLYEPELYSNRSSPISRYFYGHKQMNPNNYYILKMRINYKKNEKTVALGDLIYLTLKALEPTEEEYNFFKTDTYACYSLTRLTKREYEISSIRTRLSKKEFEDYDSIMKKVLIDYLTDFEILDNTDTISSFNIKLWGEYFAKKNRYTTPIDEYYKMIEIAKTEKMNGDCYHGTGIFNPIVAFIEDYGNSFKDFFEGIYWRHGELRGYDDGFQWDFAVLIPKADIAKYTQFTIRPKTKK